MKHFSSRWTFIQLRPVIILGLFIVLNLGLAAATSPGRNLQFGADASSWVEPARALVRHGSFSDPNNPDIPNIHRGPVYPTILALAMSIAGDNFVSVTIAFQLLLLAATGWVARQFSEGILPGYGDAALTLVIFNPNSLSTAHLIQSETVYGLLTTLLVWSLFIYRCHPGIKIASVGGSILGLSCLTRPDGQFLIILLPLLLLILPAMSKNRYAWRRCTLAAGACLFVSIIVVTPWLIRNHTIGEGFRLTSYHSANYYLWGSAAQVAMQRSGSSEAQAEAEMQRRREALVERAGADWSTLSRRDQERRMIAEAAWAIADSGPIAILKTMSLSTIQFFIAGGAGNIQNLLGYEKSNPYAVFVRQGHSSHFSGWLEAVRFSGVPALTITILAVGFAVALRVIGVLGVVTLTRRNERAILLIAISFIAYFSLVMPFYGISRFRIPVEPLLILLALCGFDGLRSRLNGQYGASAHIPSRS